MIRIYTARKMAFLCIASLFLTGCTTTQNLPTVDSVDINRFMGKWYVIANIPTFLEKNAHNAIEHYELNDNGHIETTFTFRSGSVNGPEKSYHPVGFIKNTDTNAVWGMRFVWPFKADYRIVYLSDDYTTTIIGRNKRDYVWLMSRTPQITEDEFSKLKVIIQNMGYDVSDLKRVPQEW